MKIGIDARMYGPKHSGLGRYVEQLIAQLAEIHDDNEYVIFLKADAFDSFELPNKRWKKVLADVHWYGIKEQLLMPGILKKEHVDLMHFPHWNVPWLYRKKFVVTMHDLIMFHFSRREATTRSLCIYALKDFVHRVIVTSAAKRAMHIFATSEFTKQDIIDTLNVTPKKISVTYQAPFNGKEHGTTNNEQMLHAHGITKPYVLYVGNAYPHKNVKQLVHAWKLFSEEHTEYQLVLVGKHSSWYEQIKNLVAIKKCRNVLFTGYVSDDTLIGLYEQAYLYVFPSLYEGFGLPPLEAMSRGIPVISSNASCMPEVLGSAALYFNPESTEDIARALYEGTGNEEIRYTLRQNAKHELARYSWKRLGTSTHEVYLDVTI